MFGSDLWTDSYLNFARQIERLGSAIYTIESPHESRRLLRKWAIKCCFLFLLLMVLPGVLAIMGVIPSTPVVVAVGSSATTVVFSWWFLQLGVEWQKLNPRK